MIRSIQKYSILIIFLFLQSDLSLYAMNALKPYQFPWQPYYRDIPHTFQMGLVFEKGIHHAVGFNKDNAIVNPMQIYNPKEDAIAMLRGSVVGSVPQKISLLIEEDDGIRGHFCVNGIFDHDFSLGFAARYFFQHHISFAAYLPVYRMRLHDVSWCDLTRDVTEQDVIVKENLTNNIISFVDQFGCGLSLCGWDRVGVGDLVLMADWRKPFAQGKPLLKIVELRLRAGLSLPTGLKADENKLFAFPFGYDGSLAAIVAGGLGVTLGKYIQMGFDVEITQVFDNIRLRRIKVAREQTDSLFLHKTWGHLDFGLIQQFNLFSKNEYFWKGLCWGVDYQFEKRGDDVISLSTDVYSSINANTAVSLQECTLHNFILSCGYDFGYQKSKDKRVTGRIEFFAKVPINGQRVIQSTTLGFKISSEF